jgi:SulP family sulfate permease
MSSRARWWRRSPFGRALGYASIAGAPVQVGLYAVPVALLAYAIFGSSRQLIVGPVSTVSVLSGSFLASFGVAGAAQAASYTAALALGSGLVPAPVPWCF